MSSSGALLTVPTTEAGAAEDGLMNVNTGDVLTVTYVEAADQYGYPSTRRTSMMVGSPGAKANLSVSPILVFENGSICISVMDPDPGKIAQSIGFTSASLAQGTSQSTSTTQALSNITRTTSIRTTTTAARTSSYLTQTSTSTPASTTTTPGQTGTTTAASGTLQSRNASIVVTRSNLQAQTVTLLSGLQPDLYTSCIPTNTGNSTSGLNFAERGQFFTFTYRDNAFYGNISAEAVVSRKGKVMVNPNIIGNSRTLTVTVTDQDLNQNSSSAETAQVQVSSSWADDGNNTVFLTEAGLNSDVFTGTLNTILNGAPSPKNCDYDANGCVEALSVGLAVHVREGDQLTFLYRDVALGSSAVEPANDQVAVARVGTKGVAQLSSCATTGAWSAPLCGSVLRGGGTLLVQLDDADIVFDQTSASQRSTQVVIKTSKDAQVEAVTIFETFPGSGRFTGMPFWLTWPAPS